MWKSHSESDEDVGSSDEDMDETCIFCLIANDGDEEADIMKKDNKVVCFKDLNPSAPHHYLVVPIEHILDCFSLHGGHIGLVKRMVMMGKAVLKDQGITDMTEVRMGFHKPPYTSVKHLHLHVLAPTSQILKEREYKFIPQSERFVTEKYLLEQLKDQAPPDKDFKECIVS